MLFLLWHFWHYWHFGEVPKVMYFLSMLGEECPVIFMMS